MDTLNEKIKTLREKYNLTQQQMADKLEMSLSGYRKIEYGQREPNLDTLVRLAKIFEVTTDYLLGVSGVIYGHNEKAFEVLEARNTMLVNGILYEKVKQAEGEDSVDASFAQQQYYEARGHYQKSLYEYMINYFMQQDPNPFEDVVLKDKFPIKFDIQQDLFGGVSVNIKCADGTDIQRIRYFPNTAYDNPNERAERYVKRYSEIFRVN